MDKGGRSYRFNLRVSPEWMDRVRAAAEQRGISMADFVIMVVNERFHGLDADATASSRKPAGVKRPATKRKRKE